MAGALTLAAALTVDAGIGAGAFQAAARADVSPSAGPTAGHATNYTLTGGSGNCSYPSPPPDGLFVAVSPSEWAGGTPCGEYLDITGPNGTVRAEVTDQCPPCEAGHVDMSQGAFSRIAPLPEGDVPVTYKAVSSPPLPAPLSVTVKSGSSPNWLALLPENTGNELTSVEVQDASGNWIPMTRSGYGYWIAPQGAGGGPFSVRLTDTAGHQATLYGIGLNPGQTQNTSTWMYGH